MRGGNCQTCKHFLKTDEYQGNDRLTSSDGVSLSFPSGGHYIGICQGERLNEKVDGLSRCEGFQLDSEKRNALRRDHPAETANDPTFTY